MDKSIFVSLDDFNEIVNYDPSRYEYEYRLNPADKAQIESRKINQLRDFVFFYFDKWSEQNQDQNGPLLRYKMKFQDESGMYKGYSLIQILHAICLDYPFLIDCLYLYPSDTSFYVNIVNGIRYLDLCSLILHEFDRDGNRLYQITDENYKTINYHSKTSLEQFTFHLNFMLENIYFVDNFIIKGKYIFQDYPDDIQTSTHRKRHVQECGYCKNVFSEIVHYKIEQLETKYQIVMSDDTKIKINDILGTQSKNESKQCIFVDDGERVSPDGETLTINPQMSFV